MSVVWWWLGVVVCFAAAFLLFGPDAIRYKREWIASGKSNRSYWLEMARRAVILYTVVGLLYVALRFGVIHLLR